VIYISPRFIALLPERVISIQQNFHRIDKSRSKQIYIPQMTLLSFAVPSTKCLDQVFCVEASFPDGLACSSGRSPVSRFLTKEL
jgi:hypothetical protein